MIKENFFERYAPLLMCAVVVLAALGLLIFVAVIDEKEECENSCEQLEMDFFRSEYSVRLFASPEDNCYCLKNKEVKQIW